MGLIAGAVIAGVAAMLVALALFTTYRRRRSHNRHVYMGAKPATGRTSGSVITMLLMLLAHCLFADCAYMHVGAVPTCWRRTHFCTLLF